MLKSNMLFILLPFAGALRLAEFSMQSQHADTLPSKPSIFCYIFVPFRQEEIAMFKEVKKQLSLCDGHMVYTDLEAPDIEDDAITRVRVPRQFTPRSSEVWGLGMNMIGLMPALTHLMTDPKISVSKYDWIINIEMDHIIRPTHVRTLIQESEDGLDKNNDASARGPRMLQIQNVFLFNRAMVSQMRNEWHRFGKTIEVQGAPQESIGNGCPDWTDQQVQVFPVSGPGCP